MNLAITISDLQVYRPGSYIQERVETYIQEAQMNDLRPTLGDALYYDFITKFNNEADGMYTVYQALLNEGTYEYQTTDIIYPGLKPVLAYYTLARYTENNQVNYTSYSLTQKLNPQSQPVDSRTIAYQANKLRDVAESYRIQMVQFLQTNIADYPLYNRSVTTCVPSTGFNFFKG